MSTKPKASAIEPAPETDVSQTQMYRVALKAPVSLYGILFKPGTDITVDRATLEAMGDAVGDAQPV